MLNALEFDELTRLRRASERNAQHVANTVPVGLYRDLQTRFDELQRKLTAMTANRDDMATNRDEFMVWGRQQEAALEETREQLELALSNLDKARNSLEAETARADHNRSERERLVIRATAEVQAWKAKWQKLFVEGKADRDFWKERAENAERLLAERQSQQGTEKA